jgi:hypothetical protein
MTIRLLVATSWSLLTGLSGGWLVLSPWALGVQPNGGDWKTVTSAQVGTGLGLILLALVGLGIMVAQCVGALREAGVLAGPVERRMPAPEPGERQTAPPVSEMDRALIALANTLAADLNRQQNQQDKPGSTAPAGPEAWRRTER